MCLIWSAEESVEVKRFVGVRLKKLDVYIFCEENFITILELSRYKQK